jgi:predicted XRE-type DNA-binding protein
MLRARNVRGMVMDHKDDQAVRIRSDLVLPVCDVCGEMIFTKESARALDEALETSYAAKRRKMQCALINDLRKRGFTQRQIESFASVSPGYLSKLRKGKIASGSTCRLLYLLHAMPDEAMKIVARLDSRLDRPTLEKATVPTR